MMGPKPYERDGHLITITTRRWSVDQTSGFVWNLPHGYHPHDTCTFEATTPDGGKATLTIWSSGKCLATRRWSGLSFPKAEISSSTIGPANRVRTKWQGTFTLG